MRILHNGKVVATVSGKPTRAEAEALVRGLIGGDVAPEAVSLAPETGIEARALIREEIAAEAGDHLSLLGTTSDGAQLLLFHMAKLTAALAQVQSLEEVRGAASDFAPLAEGFLAEVAAGTVRLPFEVKGAEAVLTEVGVRATAVADALDQS